MGNGSNDIRLAVKIDGVPDAQRVLSDLDKSLASVISSLNGGDRTDPNLPKRLGTHTTMASNGVGEYQIPGVTPETGAAALMSGSLLRNPSLLPNSGPPPALNLDPMNTGGNYGTHTVGASASPFQTNGGAINVNIVSSSIPLGGSNGGGGNASAPSPSNALGGGQGGGNAGIPGGGVPTSTPGGSGGTPAAQGGKGGTIPPAGGNPYAAGGFNPFSSGGGVAGLMPQIMANPTIGGVSHALLGSMPAGPSALYGGLLEAVKYGVDVYGASTQPRFQTDLSLLAQAGSGSYVNPLLADAQRRAADTRGDAAGIRAAMSPLNFLTLGAANAVWDVTGGRDLEQKAALQQAAGQDDLIRQRMSAVTGASIPKNADVTALQDRRDQAILKLRGDTSRRGASNPNYAADTAAIDSLNKQIAAAKAGLGNTALDSNSLKLQIAASAFGPDASNAMLGAAFIKKNTDGRFDADAVTASGGTLMQYALRAGNSDLAKPITDGRGIDTDIHSVVRRMIGQGDLSDLLGIQSLVKNAGEFKAAMTQAFAQTQLLQTTIPIAQAATALTQANITYDQASGTGYRGISADYHVEAASVGAQITLERQALAAMTSPLDIANEKAKIRGLEAQQKGLSQQGAMTIFQGRGTENSAYTASTSNRMYSAMYGGTQADVDAAYGLESKAGMRDYRLLLDESKSQFISPEQREVYRAQATQAKLESTIGKDRERSSYDYGITQGKVGVGSATADAAMTHAQLFGSPDDVYKAALGEAQVTQRRLDAVQGRLSDPTAHLTQNERLDLQRESIDLQRQYNQQLAEAPRQLAQMNIALAQTTQGMIQTAGNMAMGALHIGGTQAIGYVGANIGAAQGTLSAAQAAVAVLDKQGVAKDSLQYQQALAGVTQAKAGLLGGELSYASIGPSLDVQNKLADSSFQLSIMQKAMVPFGNMRGALGDQMDAEGQELRDLNKQKAASEKSLRAQYSGKDLTDALAANDLNFKQQRYSVQSQMADTQSALSQNWMSRLISQTYHAPERMGFIASQFTRSEASRFLEDSQLGGAFGFQHAGARDDVQFKYPRLMSTNIGQINRPEGFMASGMAMAMSAPPISGVLRPGDAGKLDITIKIDSKGVATAAVQHNTGRGGNAGTIHSLKNGALTMSVPLHGATSSHQ